MHDPEVVAFEIRRPWPKREKGRCPKDRWQWRRWSPFITLAGHRFYFPSLITVWHVEPGGADSNTVCKFKPVRLLGRNRNDCARLYWWQLHVHHWQLQIHPLQRLRRYLLTRCAWCGGRHTKRDPINTGTGGWYPKKAPWWRGEAEIAHSDCYSVLAAHRLCLCDDPGLSNGDYGQCAFCGKFRAWNRIPTTPERYLAALPEGSRIPPEKKDWLAAEWAKVRAEREAADG